MENPTPTGQGERAGECMLLADPVVATPWTTDSPYEAALREIRRTRAAVDRAMADPAVDFDILHRAAIDHLHALGRYEEAAHTAGIDPAVECPELRLPRVRIETQTSPLGLDPLDGDPGWTTAPSVPCARGDALLAKLEYGRDQSPGVFLERPTEHGPVYALVTLSSTARWFEYRLAVEVPLAEGVLR